MHGVFLFCSKHGNAALGFLFIKQLGIIKENKMVVLLLNSALLGIALAMDAFSVSLANGLNEPNMKRGKMCGIAGMFAFFQALMPMIGWVCVYSIANQFKAFEKFIPWIALILLGFIGGKMLYEGITGDDEGESAGGIGFLGLVVQGIATSIDALSVGFTISDYDLPSALLCAGIIAILTFFICIGGIMLGRTFGTKLAGKAGILGGVILIGIGLEIFISSFFK